MLLFSKQLRKKLAKERIYCREAKPDGVQVVAGSPGESNGLVSGRDIDPVVSIPTAPSEKGRCALVGVYAQGVYVVAVAARQADDIFVTIKNKAAFIPAPPAMKHSFMKTAV